MEELGEKIISIYNNMEYSQIEESKTIGKEWSENKMKTDSFKLNESNFSQVLDSSKKALETWHNLPAAGRRQIMLNFNKILNTNSELLSEIDAYIRKVPKSETNNVDLPGIKSYFDYYSSWPERLEDNFEMKIDHIFVDIPCPPLILSWLIAPSLAIGHAVFIHSSVQFLPLACFFVEILVQASSTLKDLVNVICTSEITSSENIPYLKHIETDYNISSQNDILQTIPSHSLESSLYSLMIVYETADLDSSAQIAVDWSTFNSGHAPWSIRRIYVQESVQREFEKKLIQRLNRKGIKQNEDTIGLKEAQALGLNIINNFLVIGGVVPSTKGVLCLSSFRTVRESLALIQSTPYLAFTSIWTESGTVAHYVARKIKMQAQVLSEKEQKKALSSSKKFKKSIKTALINYKDDLYTCMDQAQCDEITSTLGLLRKAKLNKLKIHHAEYKNLSEEEIKNRKETFLNQEERKFFVQNRKFLVPGLNSVNRQLPLGKISCVILTNVQPSLLNHHIINSCQYFHIPYVVFPSLKKLTKNYLGFKTICLGFKKEVEDPTNIFNPIFKNISALTPLDPSVKSELPKEGEKIEEPEQPKSSIISKQPERIELEINFDEIYCKRNNSNKRTFQPSESSEDNLKLNAKKPRLDPFALQNYFSSSKEEIKTNNVKINKGKDQKIYKKVKLKTITKQEQKKKYFSKNITLK